MKLSKPALDRRALLAGAGLAGALVVTAAIFVVLDVGPFGPGEELERGEFETRGNAICREARQEFDELQRTPPRTAREAEELTARLLEISDQEQVALAELSPPAELEAGMGRYLEVRRAGIELMREGVDAAADGDASAYARAQKRVAAGQPERAKLASAIGLPECSRPVPRKRLDR